MNRRHFLHTSTSATAFLAAPAVVRGQNLNSRLQMASVGTDGKGFSDTREMVEHGKTVHIAFCDVDLNRTARVRELRPNARVFRDYRRMFDKLGDKIDAVTVSTPDHTHAIITLDALRRGMHVYCQKPLTHTVWEARQVALQAKKSGVITRLGNQIHSHTHYRTAVHAIQSGIIGKIKRVHSWVNAPGHGRSGFIDRPKNPPPKPENLAWNNWLGPAPWRPYGGERIYHPWGWRDWQDFGGGALADFGCHILDPVFTALQMKSPPLEISADHTGMNDEVWPCQATVDYVFPGTQHTAGKKLHLTWYHGGLRPGEGGPTKIPLPRSGSLLIGEEGTLVVPHSSPAPSLYPEEKFPEGTIEVVEGSNHYHDWVDGCLAGTQPSDDFEYGALLTESALLGNIASRFRGQRLKWDAEAFRFTNLEEANPWLTKEYREGWKIEPVA